MHVGLASAANPSGWRLRCVNSTNSSKPLLGRAQVGKLRCSQAHARGDQTANAVTLPQLKQELQNMSGSKNGVDLSEDKIKEVLEHLSKFKGLGCQDPACMELSGTKWKVIFTDTDGAASGKLGPFVGSCTLEFPTEKDYVANISHFGGALSIDLVVKYSVKNNTRINLDLIRNDFKLFGFKVGSVPLDLKGHHTVKFADEDVRIFQTNMGSNFATVRL